MIGVEVFRKELQTHKATHQTYTSKCRYCWLYETWRRRYAQETAKYRFERGYRPIAPLRQSVIRKAR